MRVLLDVDERMSEVRKQAGRSRRRFWVVVAVWQGGCFRPKLTLRHLLKRRDFL